MNASALAKKLSGHVRRMFKGAEVTVEVPHKAMKLTLFKDSPDSWNFAIKRKGTRSDQVLHTVVYVRQMKPGVDVLVEGPDSTLIRDMIAEAWSGPLRESRFSLGRPRP